MNPTAAGRHAPLLHPFEGYGQMGLTRQRGDGEDVRVGSELSRVATPAGRYRIDSTRSADGGGGRVGIDPSHPYERDFVSKARR